MVIIQVRFRQLSNVLLSTGGNRRFKNNKQGTITDFEGLYIVLNRSRMREKNGSDWELHLSGTYSSSKARNGTVKLIDDSNVMYNPSVRTQTVFNVVSGSIELEHQIFALVMVESVGLFYLITDYLFYLKLS